MCIVNFCLMVLTIPGGDNVTERQLTTCVDVLEQADDRGLNLALVASVGWHESRFMPKLTSSAGAKGPLQVIPKYWCRSKPCDLIAAGLLALETYHRNRTLKEALCRYSTGRGCKRNKAGMRYARKVVKMADEYADWHSFICYTDDGNSSFP